MCECFKTLLLVNQKIYITLSAIFITGLGVTVIVCGIMARTSSDFEMVSQMITTETNESFDFEKAVLGLIVLGALAVVGGFFGCYGAWSEHRGALAAYSFFAFLMGLFFSGMGIAMRAFLDTTGPVLIKETNRICRDTDLTKRHLDCPVSQAITIPDDTANPTVPPNIMASPVARLLLSASTGSWRLSDVPMGVAVLSATAWDMQSTHNLTRRLQMVNQADEPGSTENHFLRRLCDYEKQEDASCANICTLIDDLCAPPKEFFPKSACLCAGVATPGSEIGTHPVLEGTYCSAWTEGEEEWCYVLDTTECSDGYETESVGGHYGKSNGPCYVPSARSKVMQDGSEVASAIAIAALLLGAFLLFSILCSCSFCFELHTGKKVHKHINSLTHGDSSSDEERY